MLNILSERFERYTCIEMINQIYNNTFWFRILRKEPRFTHSESKNETNMRSFFIFE